MQAVEEGAISRQKDELAPGLAPVLDLLGLGDEAFDPMLAEVNGLARLDLLGRAVPALHSQTILIRRRKARAFENLFAGDLRAFGDEVLLVDAVLVAMGVGNLAPLADIFLDIDDFEDDDYFFGFGLHGAILSPTNPLGIHSVRVLCHAESPLWGHVSRERPAVRAGPAGSGRRPSVNWVAVFVFESSHYPRLTGINALFTNYG